MPESTDWRRVAEAMHDKLLEIPCTCIETAASIAHHAAADKHAEEVSKPGDKDDFYARRFHWLIMNTDKIRAEDYYDSCIRCQAMLMCEQASDQEQAARVS